VDRPFSEKDMVVSKLYGVGIITFMNAKNGNFVADFKLAKNVYIPSGEVSHPITFEWVLDIITIRKPRKGAKEARDIVAMLANARRHGLNDLLIICGKDKKLRCKFKRIFEMGMSHILYVKAKSMLGASNE